MIKKILYTKDGKKLYIRDLTKDYHSQFGVIKKSLLKRKVGSTIKTNIGKELTVSTPNFIDLYSKIQRAPQIIPQKDIGLIIAKTGIGKNSNIVDAGSGSGALSLLLSNIVKKITTYELRADHFKIAKKNIADLGFSNIKIKNKNINKITEKNLDLITLDLPEPWEHIAKLKDHLRNGGFIVSYSPTIPQVMDLNKEVSKHLGLQLIDNIELIERSWEIKGRKVRPKSLGIGHSGFLSFIRRIG